MRISVFLTLLLSLKGTLSAVVTLSGDATVNEGLDMVLICTVDVVQPSRNIIVPLIVFATSTAENGFDTADVTQYSCVISAGAMSGSVSIPTFIDEQIETVNEAMVIHGTVSAPDTIAAATVSFNINHVAGITGDGNIYVRPLCTENYEGPEGGNIDLVVEFVDALGAPVPLEADYALSLIFYDDTATSVTGGGGAPDDYNDNTAVGMLLGSVNGIPAVTGTVQIPLVADTLVENAERFRFSLVDAGTAGVVVDTGTLCSAIIFDDDKPGIHVLNSYGILPRGSHEIVPQIVFTGGMNTGIALTMGPYETNVKAKDLDGFNGKQFRFPRPNRRSRTRITEYVFSATETVGAVDYEQAAVSHMSATSRKSLRATAPINTLIGSTITVHPSPTAGSTDLEEPATVAIFAEDYKFWSQIRWSFIGTRGEKIRLRGYKRKPSITVTKQRHAGLYAIYRLGRGNKGWVQYVRVILSECPKGMYHVTPGMCDGGPITCQHGGIVDPSFSEGLCTCTPGFIGRFCEIPVDQGNFGHNGQYHVNNFPHLQSTNGRGVTFSFNHPFGNTCASGYWGPGCWWKCKKGFFGAGCEFECNCIDDVCTETGICINGCARGASGDTCQN